MIYIVAHASIHPCMHANIDDDGIVLLLVVDFGPRFFLSVRWLDLRVLFLSYFSFIFFSKTCFQFVGNSTSGSGATATTIRACCLVSLPYYNSLRASPPCLSLIPGITSKWDGCGHAEETDGGSIVIYVLLHRVNMNE